ncbi:MAG: aminoacetone oxidase family FAD-binding enzyme [Myxococcales bacterium]|nr:aminoacetone oxidase family FAD-binding enzyme [Myxococcales bacterium]
MPKVVIVGAGAAGLWAAAVAAKRGADVLVLEKTPRAGTKILASGGTRCNLTTTLGPREAARLFGREGEAFLKTALGTLSPADVRAHVERLGVPTVTEPELEKVFPRSQRAVDVRDALVDDAERAGARIRYRTATRELRREGAGFRVVTDGGEVVADRVILAAGGRSYARTGTSGDGYAWLRALGLRVVPPVPALVPLLSDAEWVRELTGIALQHVEARLLDPTDRLVTRRRRPVLFTHLGLSGPGAMDLSAPIARAAMAGPTTGWKIALDLLPDVGMDALRDRLSEASRQPGGPTLARALGETELPARILAAACEQAGLPANPRLHEVPKKQRNRLVDALKGLRVPISGTLGFDHAEVTAGGLALEEVDPASCEVRTVQGLYVVGELLDLDGVIGGLSFQAAFSTAELAARHASR